MVIEDEEFYLFKAQIEHLIYFVDEYLVSNLIYVKTTSFKFPNLSVESEINRIFSTREC